MTAENTTFDYTPDEQNEDEAPAAATFSWSSAEFIGHNHGAGWYMLLILVTVGVGAVIYFVTKSYFATAVIAVLGVIVGVFAGRTPGEIKYEINDEGLKIGEKSYPFRQFKSFSISRGTELSSLNLTPIKRISPPVSAFFEPSQEAKVLDAIGESLPFEERKPDSIERIAHKLKL